jgi:hypothetical protein
MMERAMSLFAPFARTGDAADARPGAPASPSDELEALRAEVAFLRGQLARLQNGTAAPTPPPAPAKKAAGGKE